MSDSFSDNLRRWNRECTGWEPSMSVLQRGADEAADTIEELVDALRRIQDEANTVCGDWRETASLIDSICLAALRKIGGDA